MTSITVRQTFRDVLAQAAAQARALLPVSTNGRIESAVKLVLSGDVFFCDDGTVQVGGSDPTRYYRLVGTTCTCTDFVQEKAPQGMCKHRIAANLQRSVERVLARSTPVESEVEVILPEEMEVWSDNDIEAPLPEEVEAPSPLPCPVPLPLPEAAFSLTLKGTLDGVEALLTARGQTAAEFQRNLAAIRGLLDAKPQPPAQASSPAPDATPQCPQHGALKPSTKGQGWYCPQKTAEGTWCPTKRK
jgi:hypothetical protein